MQETPVKRRGLKIAGSIAALVILAVSPYFVRHRTSNIAIQAEDAVVYTKSCVGTTNYGREVTLQLKEYFSGKTETEVRVKERDVYEVVLPAATNFQELKANAEKGACEEASFKNPRD